jgi:hypothetical protein
LTYPVAPEVTIAAKVTGTPAFCGERVNADNVVVDEASVGVCDDEVPGALVPPALVAVTEKVSATPVGRP